MPDAPVAAPIAEAPVLPPPIQTPLEDAAPDPVDAPEPVAPVAVVPPVAAAPVAVVTTPAPEPAKLVPLSAVHEERTRRQTAESRLAQADPVLALLHANPDIVALLEARRTGAPIAPAPAAEQAELEAVATDYVLYKSDGSGKLDLDAARRVRDGQRANAEAVVAKALRDAGLPALRETIVRNEAQTQRQRIETLAKEKGVKSEHLAPLLDQAMADDPSSLNDPRVGAALIISAIGLQTMLGGTPALVAPAPLVTPVIPPAPLVTESPGARPAGAPDLSPMERRLAKKHGLTPEAWAKTSAKLGSGDINPTGRHIHMEKDE